MFYVVFVFYHLHRSLINPRYVRVQKLRRHAAFHEYSQILHSICTTATAMNGCSRSTNGNNRRHNIKNNNNTPTQFAGTALHTVKAGMLQCGAIRSRCEKRNQKTRRLGGLRAKWHHVQRRVWEVDVLVLPINSEPDTHTINSRALAHVSLAR